MRKTALLFLPVVAFLMFVSILMSGSAVMAAEHLECNGKPLVWDKAKLNIYIDLTGLSLVNREDYGNVVELAFQAWTNIDGSSLQFIFIDDINNADIILNFGTNAYNPYTEDYDGSSLSVPGYMGITKITGFIRETDYPVTKIYVTIYSEISSDPVIKYYTEAQQLMLIENIAKHEAGHCALQAESLNPDDVMCGNSTIEPLLEEWSLTKEDIRGILRDYPIPYPRQSNPREGCFIATATYGSELAEEIELLREFRDQYLLSNPIGEALVNFYYQVSPPIAKLIIEHPVLKPITKIALTPAIAISTVVVKSTSAQKIMVALSMTLIYVLLIVWFK